MKKNFVYDMRCVEAAVNFLIAPPPDRPKIDFEFSLDARFGAT